MRTAAVFLFSVAILGAQIVWTRIFSFSVWYHFAFLVISIAMLGFTSGGLLLTLKPKLLERDPDRLLAATSIAFSLASMLSLVLVINLPFDGGILESVWNFALFVALIGLVCFQFFWAGLYIAFAIASEPKDVAKIYFANMCGSGVGCAASGFFLDNMLPPAAFLSFALLALLSGLLLLWRREDSRRLVGVALGALVLLALCYGSALQPLAEPFFLKSTKDFPALDKEQIIARTGNSLATLDFFRPRRLNGLWGISGAEYERDHPGRDLPRRMGYCIDSWALTFSYNDPAGDIVEHPVWDYLPAGLAYQTIHPEEVLIIGAGGGIDVIAALRGGGKDITAVDINPAIIDAGVNRFKDWNQGIFHRPGVHPVVAEGRSYLTAAADRKWDLIQLSGVDTLAASQAGAFTLSENFLYTQEAFESYLEHLQPGGVATLTRWMYNPPRQTLRVIMVAAAALEAMGVEETEDHIILVADSIHNFSVILLSMTPFSQEQIDAVIEHSAAHGFSPLAVPGQRIKLPRRNPFEDLVRMSALEKAAFEKDYLFDISVTTDDKPFFMEHSRWSNAWSHPDYIFNKSNGHLLLLATTVIVALFALLFITLPARLAGVGKGGPVAGRARTLVYFSCLGLGYVLVEIVLVQKLTLYLGNPSYALAVVLSAMLLFSGVGAMVAGKLRGDPARRVLMACAAVATVIVVYLVVLDLLIGATLQLPIATRVALTLLVLAPPAMLMGIPFPTAIEALGAKRQDLVVGGWVVNGYFSVLASCLAMVLSISTGFKLVLLMGAVIYAAAAVARPLRGL